MDLLEIGVVRAGHMHRPAELGGPAGPSATEIGDPRDAYFLLPLPGEFFVGRVCRNQGEFALPLPRTDHYQVGTGHAPHLS